MLAVGYKWHERIQSYFLTIKADTVTQIAHETEVYIEGSFLGKVYVELDKAFGRGLDGFGSNCSKYYLALYVGKTALFGSGSDRRTKIN